jgi:hypothetical protein
MKLFKSFTLFLLMLEIFTLNLKSNSAYDNRYLEQDELLTSPNGKYYIKMQSDGNFCLYSKKGLNGMDYDHPIWATMTNGKGSAPYKAVMQEDGNLIVYDSKKSALWSSGTNGKGTAPFKLLLEDNGLLELIDANKKQIWSSKTGGKV